MMRVFVVAGAVFCCGCALAKDGEPLPDYHLTEKCRAQSKAISGNASNALSGDCLTSEQAAYDNLKKYWPKLDEAQKAKCIAASARQKIGNYRILQQCLNREELKVDGMLKDDPNAKRPTR